MKKNEHRVRRGSVLLAFVLASVAFTSAGASVATATGPDNLGAAASPGYIVQLRNGSQLRRTVADQRRFGVKVQRSWSQAVVGFSAQLSATDLRRLRHDPRVRSVERDRVVHADAIETSPPWGLDRIDQHVLPLGSSYRYASNGAGVKVYVVDSGIRSTHSEFTGRVATGAYIDFGDGTKTQDCNGHGTHVSGTIGGTTYGVAKGVTLVPVKALNCAGSGTTAGVISALNWVVTDHLAGQPAVVNMSLEGGVDSLLDAAVNAVIADGVTVVVAAGNSATNACNVSPARVPNAITVGASDSTDANANFTNYGTCNDLFAPGVNVISAWDTSDTAIQILNGTSMASPHVAGAAALALHANPTATPAQVWTTLDAASTKGVVVDSVGLSPNKLLYSDPLPIACASGLTDSLAWWQGQNALTAHNGPALTGSAGYTAGVVGNGIDIGASGALSVDGFPAVSTGLSFEAWIKPVRNQWGAQDIVSRWNMITSDAYARVFTLQLLPNDQIAWATDDNTLMMPFDLRVTAPQMYDGSYHHLAVTWDQTRFALYLDGALLATRSSQGGLLNAAASTQFRLGSQAGIGDPFWYLGAIDEPAVFGRALTADEVSRIYWA
ncbi:MAG: S8 family serine peptidase, partial [Actinomycetota bacterium]